MQFAPVTGSLCELSSQKPQVPEMLVINHLAPNAVLCRVNTVTYNELSFLCVYILSLSLKVFELVDCFLAWIWIFERERLTCAEVSAIIRRRLTKFTAVKTEEALKKRRKLERAEIKATRASKSSSS